MPGHTPEEIADAIHAEIDSLKKEDISDEELKMVKTRAKANLMRSLDSNEGLATNLAEYQTFYGDWRELFQSVDRIERGDQSGHTPRGERCIRAYEPNGGHHRKYVSS